MKTILMGMLGGVLGYMMFRFMVWAATRSVEFFENLPEREQGGFTEPMTMIALAPGDNCPVCEKGRMFLHAKADRLSCNGCAWTCEVIHEEADS